MDLINKKKRVKEGSFRISGKRYLRIGLTGGIGSGKSTVLNIFREMGIHVLQADHVARILLEKTVVKKKILNHFGKNIFDKDGRVIRSELAAAAFKNRKQQKLLNQILHSMVRKKISSWILNPERRRSSIPVVVIEVPLLFERGYYRFFDAVLSVSASQNIRQRRLLKRGWEKQEIIRRERLQWPQGRKNGMANWVIFNNGSEERLRNTVEKWCEIIRAKLL